MSQTYPIHPLAAAFPEMAPEEFDDLKKSVQQHGLRHKIVLLPHEGQPHILDGRNRYKACLELKIPPIFRDYDPIIDGEIPVAFVADENLNRRNLTTSQRAAIAAELEPYFAAALKEARKAKTTKPSAKTSEPGPATEEKAPAPEAEKTPVQTEDEKVQAVTAELSEIHKLAYGSNVLRGCVARHFGKALEDNPHEAGHPAHDLWNRGWEREEARLKEVPTKAQDEDDDLEIGSRKQPEGEQPAPAAEPASENPEPAPAKQAADLAAEATGVSKRTVSEAKALKEKAPEEFQKVKEGEKTLHQAAKDAKEQAQKISPYRQESADMLEGVFGEEFSDAIKNLTVLKTSAELEAFMKLSQSHQKEVIPFVVKGWKVADSIKFLRGEFDIGTTAGELISYCNAKGGDVAVEIGEFTFTITKSKPDAAKA